MGRSIFLGVLVLFLGALLVLLLGSPEPRDRTGVTETARETSASGDGPEAAPSIATPGSVTETPSSPFDGTSSKLPGVTTTRAAAPPDGEGTIQLTLVRRDNGQRVPGATVRYFVSALTSDRERFSDLMRVDALMGDRGRELESDSDGNVWVPPASRGFTYVTAAAPGLWGKAILQAGTSAPRELALDLDASIAVRVLRADGEPAVGAPVALRSQHGRQLRSIVTTTTDRRGRARFPHVGAALSQREDATGWQVGVDVPTEELIARSFDPTALPTEEIELVLPAVGAVVVRVREVDGEPYAGAGHVGLGVVAEGEGRQRSAFAVGDRIRVTEDIVEATARFDWVPLGEELELRAERTGALIPTVAYAAGPTRAGEEVRVDLQLGSDHPVLMGRVVDGAGVAVGSQTLGVLIERHSQHLIDDDEGTVATDAGGRFLLDLDRDWLPDTKRTLTVFLGEREQPELLASLDLSRAFDPGLHDLGTLRLGEPPVFVRGEVVDGRGNGIAGATLRLERERATGDRSHWAEVWDFRHRTNDDGSFEVAGNLEGEDFRLSIAKDGYAATPVPFRPGATVRVVATSAGELPGSLVFDEGFPLAKLQLSIESEEAGPDERTLSWRDARKRPDKKGRFRFSRLQPGAYRVELTIDGDPEPLATIEHIFVRGGGETVEPRLQKIDLRGRVNVHRITLKSPKPAESLSGRLQLRPSGIADARWEWRHFRDNEVELISRHPTIDVMVNVDGYRAESIEGLRGDTVIELRGGLPVRLVLVGDADVPDPPICLKAALLDDKSPHGAIDWGAACFDQTRETRTHVNGPGHLRVQWVIERSSSGSAVALTPEVKPLQYVDVADTPGEQVIEVRLTQAQLDEFVRTLGG